MRPADFAEFTELLDAISSMLSRGQYRPSAMSHALFFNALTPYSLEQVRAALDAHCRDPKNGRFAPLPADIIGQIEAAKASDGRPDGNEAWALALRASDEAETVIWTAETAHAWALARPVLEAGDKVGARMAFLAAYDRLVGEARERMLPPAWSVSEGHDPQKRQIAMQAASEAGKLLGYQPPAPASVAGLLELAEVHECPPEIRAKLQRIRDRNPDPLTPAQRDRARTAALKHEAARLVAEATGGIHA